MDLLGGTNNKNRMKKKFLIISILSVSCNGLTIGKDYYVRNFGANGNGKNMI
jgi:hypothetical protein